MNRRACVLLVFFLLLTTSLSLAQASAFAQPNGISGQANLTNASLNASNASSALQPEPALPCNSTQDCKFGYCIDSKCVLPKITNFVRKGPCNSTADCIEGFCQKETCLVPLPLTEVFEFGPKPSCSPIIECPPGSPCILFCDLLPIILALLSFVAAFVSRKEKNRLVPIILFLLPLVLGFFIYAMVGILVASVEIVLFFSRNHEQAEDKKPQNKQPAIQQAPIPQSIYSQTSSEKQKPYQNTPENGNGKPQTGPQPGDIDYEYSEPPPIKL